jgi:hypothetical protein
MLLTGKYSPAHWQVFPVKEVVALVLPHGTPPVHCPQRFAPKKRKEAKKIIK